MVRELSAVLRRQTAGMCASPAPGGGVRSPAALDADEDKAEDYVQIPMFLASQVEVLIRELLEVPEQYVWMDQFCIPQATSHFAVNEKNTTSGLAAALHEDKKRVVRQMLIPLMTGLYSCGSRVVALDNSGDRDVAQADWYQNRLWCMQEYCFPQSLRLAPLVVQSDGRQTTTLEQRRGLVIANFFGSSKPPADPLAAYAVALDTSIDQGAASKSGATSGLEVLLDWIETSGHGDMKKQDQGKLERLVAERVLRVGSAGYLELVGRMSASDTNDSLSALAQPWFGIIMTDPSTKIILVRALINHALAHTEQSHRTASAGGKMNVSNPSVLSGRVWTASEGDGTNMELLVVDNPIERLAAGMTGTLVVDRMLSAPAAGMEHGEAVEVLLECTSAVSKRADGIFQCQGLLVHPKGFEGLMTRLQYLPVTSDETLPARPAASHGVDEDGLHQAFRLHRMTVRQISEEMGRPTAEAGQRSMLRLLMM